MTALEPGQSIDLATRVDGGIVIERDSMADDILNLDRAYHSFSRNEVEAMARAFGLVVLDPNEIGPTPRAALEQADGVGLDALEVNP